MVHSPWHSRLHHARFKRHVAQVPQRNLGCPAARPAPSTHLREQLLQGALQAQAHARQWRGWATRHGGTAHRARTPALAHCPALEAEFTAVVAAGANHWVLLGERE